MEIKNNKDKKNSIKIIASNITSRLGNSVFDYANQMIISQLFTKTPLYLGIYQSSEQIIGIIFNLFAGVFADNHNRKKMLIYTDFLSGIVCVFGLLLLSSKVLYLILVIGNILLAILHSYNAPLYNSIVKESISESYIERHISIFTVFKELAKVVAPVIGLLIWRLFGIKFAYVFNAITFFLSAFISRGIQITSENLNEEKKNDKYNILSKIRVGITYILKNKMLRDLLLLSAAVNFFLSSFNILLPYLTQYYEKKLTNFFGLALITQSIGAIVFSLINTKFLTKLRANNHTKMILNLFLLGVSIFVIPLLDLFLPALFNLVSYFCVGGFLTIFNIQFFSLVQKKAASEYIGRVYSVIFTISILFMPIGNILFGSILSTSNLIGMVISGVGVILTVVVYLLINKSY